MKLMLCLHAILLNQKGRIFDKLVVCQWLIHKANAIDDDCCLLYHMVGLGGKLAAPLSSRRSENDTRGNAIALVAGISPM